MKKNYYRKRKSTTKFMGILALFLLMFSGCSKDEDPQPQPNDPDPIPQPEEPVDLPPIALACDYFNEDRVLQNDTLRPVDYVISCWANVRGALKIEPGVVIEFEENAGLYVNLEDKLFEVKGTVEKPIIFSGTSKQKGFWKGLFFTEAYNHDNIIEHTIIEYAGSEDLTSTSPIYEGSLALRGVSGTPPQALTLNHVEIRNGGSVGLDFHGIRKNATVSTSNLVITGHEDVPVKVSAEMAHVFDNTSSYIGNVSDFFNITTSYYELEDQTVAWQKLDVPYLIDGRVHLKKDAHLTIEEGVEIQLKSDAYLQVAPLLPPYNTSLQILGTAENPVYLKAHTDTWGGIYYGHTQEDNVIDYAVIEHARGEYAVGNLKNSGAIYMHGDPALTVTNTTFKDLPNYAAYAYTGASPNEPELPNFIFISNTVLDAKGSLGWGNGKDTHYPIP